MTYSILARDPSTGRIGGAAATGSLCVGGWVLRADPRAGVSASQGAAPSTFWGEEVLAAMARGAGGADAVAAVTGADPGREARQLAALGLAGRGGIFTGRDNTPAMGGRFGPDSLACGNLLTGEEILDAALERFAAAAGDLPDRLLAALRAGAEAGGDSRGLQSAALLIVGPDIAPLTLRIDYAADPVAELEALHARTQAPDYAGWLQTVPVPDDPHRR